MKGKKEKERMEGARELEQSIHMLPIPKVKVDEPLKIKVAVSQQQSEQNLAMEEWYRCCILFNIAQIESWYVAHQ